MKWYIGVIKNKYGIGSHERFIIREGRIETIVFPYSGELTEEKFGEAFLYVYGPFKTKQSALREAYWQGFRVTLETSVEVEGFARLRKRQTEMEKRERG